MTQFQRSQKDYGSEFRKDKLVVEHIVKPRYQKQERITAVVYDFVIVLFIFIFFVYMVNNL